MRAHADAYACVCAAAHVSRACLWLHVTDSGGAAAQEPRQKVLDRDTAAQMLRIALPRTEPHLGAPRCAPLAGNVVLWTLAKCFLYIMGSGHVIWVACQT